jgi:hypothetical protein
VKSHSEPHYQTDASPALHISPEQHLFLQVISIAVTDYRGKITGQRLRAPGLTAAQKAAEAWLFSPLHEKDFFTVCAFANVEPEFVRDIAKRDRRLTWSRQ